MYLFAYFSHNMQMDTCFNFSLFSIARGSMTLKMVVY